MVITVIFATLFLTANDRSTQSKASTSRSQVPGRSDMKNYDRLGTEMFVTNSVTGLITSSCLALGLERLSRK